ncbi:hypothetical protein GCM10010326_34370 [Streptomyces xanthochromogenes]|uniref:Uncharacterized protein n=1 Tax=Streptomyces xanthochromogenes TaxID=67384 RepID=A0ABQ3A601_9ACTN|nr:hypothetical protein GCM10010326_34370 [Streptomyces xanthochromogenes]
MEQPAQRAPRLLLQRLAGRALAKGRFRSRLRNDLTEVFAALQRGDITAQIAAQLPLGRAAEALRLAESGTVTGKVVLTP